MRETDIRLVQGFPIFRSLSEPDFRALVHQGEFVDCPTHAILARQGELPDRLFILADGLFESASIHASGSTTVSFIRPPTAFILAAVVMHQPYLVTARALVPSRVFSIPINAFHTAMEANPVFALAVCRELATRYRDMVKELKNLKTRTAIQRLANWILTEAKFANADRFELLISKAILASRLGMTNEHLSRAFAQLRTYGVDVKGRKVHLVDREALTVFADPDPLIDGIDS